jgi:hypothetical protein
VGCQVVSDEDLHIPPGELHDPGKENLDRKRQKSSIIGQKTTLESRYPGYSKIRLYNGRHFFQVDRYST